ncbi:acyltransferase family protein [Nocardioides alkalitolerans]|uniref:acyltransferase family protein n=1 Tax=Nocardioides alkalitolerans TaxID=281714 RepID=UPI00040CBF84|nr:acyltransferase family protein [Nocardioides alkalitolerans]
MNPGETASRAGWIDIAKGISILLVVWFHAAIVLDLQELAGPWRRLAIPLDGLRMPLFFTVSGVFAAKVLALRLPELWSRRVANLLWLYVVWVLLSTVVFGYVTASGEPGPGVSWSRTVDAFRAPHDHLWFLLALGVYFLVAWATRRLPVLVQLLPAAAMAVYFSSAWALSHDPVVAKIGGHLVYFLAAVRLGPRLLRLAPRVTPLVTLTVLATWALLVTTAIQRELLLVPGVRPGLSLLALTAGIGLSVLLARSRVFDVLAWLGRSTLPVYVLHFFPLMVLARLFTTYVYVDERPPVIVLRLLTPVLVLLAVGCSLAVHRLTRWVPGLYALPRWRRPRRDPAALPPSSPEDPARVLVTSRGGTH